MWETTKSVLPSGKWLLLLLSCCTLLKQLPAQNLDQWIQIRQPRTDITGIAKVIAAQTGLHYSLNMQNASLKKIIVLKPGRYSLQQLLQQVRIQAALDYRLLGDHLLFLDRVAPAGHNPVRSPSTPPPQRAVARTTAKRTPHRVLPRTAGTAPPALKRKAATRPPVGPLPSVDPLPPLKARLLSTGIVDTHTDTVATTIPVRPHPAALRSLLRSAPAVTAPAAAARPVSRSLKWYSPLLRVGVGGDELYYWHATLQGGMQAFYGIAEYAGNFNETLFRWGAGTSFRLSDDTRLHITVTTGVLRANYDVDTFKNAVHLNERVSRLAGAWSKTWHSGLTLQLQAHLNWLQKSFTETRQSNWPDFLKGDVDGRYRILTPPYTFYHKATTTSSSRLWIGIRCSLFYPIFRNR